MFQRVTPTELREAPARDATPIEAPPHVGRWAVLVILLTAATVAIMVAIVGPEHLLEGMRALNPAWLLLALGIEALALACLVQVHRAVFAVTHGELPLRDAITVALGSFTLAQLLPGGGAAGAVFTANRLSRHSDGVTGTTSAALFGISSMATLGMIVSLGATVTALATGTHIEVAIVAGAATVLILGVLVVMGWALTRPGLRHRVVERAARLTRRGPEVTSSWHSAIDRQADLLVHPLRLRRIVAWSALNWSLDIVVLGAVAFGVGVRVPVLAIVVAYGVANLVNGIPLTPGGIGVVEAGLTGTLVAMGADPANATLTAIAYRLVSDWIPIIVAAPIVITGMRSSPARPPRSPFFPGSGDDRPDDGSDDKDGHVLEVI